MSRKRDRKLSLRRETLRAMTLGRDQLARVAGGGGFLSDECSELSAPCDTLGKTSKYCPMNE